MRRVLLADNRNHFARCTYSVGRPDIEDSFHTIQEAVDAVGQNSAGSRVTICIGAGTYLERVIIRAGQDGITFAGIAMQTRIVGNVTSEETGSPWDAGTLTVYGDNFMAKNIMVENSAKTVKYPAPAVVLFSGTSSWVTVALIAWDDTVALRAGNHFFKKTFISGVVDIVWGFSRAAMLETEISSRFFFDPAVVYTGHVATFGTDAASNGTKAGMLCINCKISGKGLTFLGRPYRAQQDVVFINTTMGENVRAEGWDDYAGNLALGEFNFREYNSLGPGANTTGRKFGLVFEGPPPEEYTLEGFIGRIDDVESPKAEPPTARSKVPAGQPSAAPAPPSPGGEASDSDASVGGSESDATKADVGSTTATQNSAAEGRAAVTSISKGGAGGPAAVATPGGAATQGSAEIVAAILDTAADELTEEAGGPMNRGAVQQPGTGLLRGAGKSVDQGAANGARRGAGKTGPKGKSRPGYRGGKRPGQRGAQRTVPPV